MALPVSRFPALKPDQVLRLLRRIGYQKVRQRGSHIVLRAEGRQAITISMHKGRTVKPKHLRAMLVDRVGLTEETAEQWPKSLIPKDKTAGQSVATPLETE